MLPKQAADLESLEIIEGKDLTVRKRRLLDAGDCLVTLPGGVGTFDEVSHRIERHCVCRAAVLESPCSAMIVGSLVPRQLFMAIAERGVGCSELPVLLLNTDGYYDGSIRQLTRAHDEGMLRKHWTEYVDVVNTPEEAVQWCLKQKRRPPEPAPAVSWPSPYARGLLHGAGAVALLALWLVHRK